ncbi:ATP-binding protein [Corynebacterium callunae]|uniref:ATP-binding protein n=1 Tax=Corynebacterium callunae TaxID=1721 RepID=UPI001FFF010D|nr:putative DNA binding domain-containing protein [Corynebacterium callunae]
MTELDTSRAPRGLLAAQALVKAAAQLGDLAERHYLELKSTLDLSQKKDKEKIAKFILGAANRMPDVAASVFEGFGVMLIGVAKDEIVGIPPVEMMDISQVVQKYLGANGPRWDIQWVPIENSSNQVLMVLVDPPLAGQGPFPCRASGESLTDGRVYIRADGQTREATSGELDLLLERGKACRKFDMDFSVEVLGQVAAVECDDATTVEDYLATKRESLLDALPKKSPRAESELQSGIADTGSIFWPKVWARNEDIEVNSLFMEPEERTEEQYRAEIDAWEDQVRHSWAGAKARIAASVLSPTIVKVTNHTSVFLYSVELKLDLEGNISGSDWLDLESILTPAALELPTSPRRWGPKRRQPFGLAHDFSRVSQMGNTLALVPSPISYENEGSVHITADIGDLRPRGVFESERDELVLIVTDRLVKSIHGSWEITARDHNEVFTGEIDIETAGVIDITEIARLILGQDIDIDG